MATLTVQSANRFPGLVPTYAAAAGGGDSFLPGATTFLHFKNGGGANEAYVNSPVTTPVDLGAVTVDLPATSERLAGPFPADIFGDPTDGLADIAYFSVTSLTIAVIQIPQP